MRLANMPIDREERETGEFKHLYPSPWPDSGEGVGGPRHLPQNRTAIYLCINVQISSDFIQAWRIEKHELKWQFLFGGEGGKEWVSVEVETFGEPPPPLK